MRRKLFRRGLFAFTEQFTVDWRGMAAMSVIMMIPAVIFVILGAAQSGQRLDVWRGQGVTTIYPLPPR